MSLNYFYGTTPLNQVYLVDSGGSTVPNYTNFGSDIKFRLKTVDIETQNANSYFNTGINFDSAYCAYFLDDFSTTVSSNSSPPGSSKSGSFTTPPNCTIIKCILIGAGSGSSQNAPNPQGGTFFAGFGGGGGFLCVGFNVTGNTVYNYTVGNAGQVGANANALGRYGGPTTIGGYSANAGTPGDGGNSTGQNGTGGTTTLGSGGVVLYSGNANGVGQNSGYNVFSKGSNLPPESSFSPTITFGRGGDRQANGTSGFIRVYFICNP